MKIHLNRAGQSLGQFTPDEVRSGFQDGKFTATDLAWRDGMPMWKPLGEVIDEIAPDSALTEPGAVAPPIPVTADVFPWEQRAEKGFLHALLETIRLEPLRPSFLRPNFWRFVLLGLLAANWIYLLLAGRV